MNTFCLIYNDLSIKLKLNPPDLWSWVNTLWCLSRYYEDFLIEYSDLSLSLSTFFFAENSKNFSSDSRRLWQVSRFSRPVVTFRGARVIIKSVIQTCSSHRRGQKDWTWITGLTDQILLVKTEINWWYWNSCTREGKFYLWGFVSEYIIFKSVQSAFY
jgi:hypothetical protein